MLRWCISGRIVSLLDSGYLYYTTGVRHSPVDAVVPSLMRVDYDKLVRDRIPEIIGSRGDRAVARVLDEAAYRGALLAKLVEEAQEASRAGAEELPAELADVLEVLQALAKAVGTRRQQADTTRRFRRTDLPRIRRTSRKQGFPHARERYAVSSWT
jgi:predicted house-cleaning noncanonical NTP pyrophosphatase (MazG superfamily)